jgi:poly(hydroxyalkanoate) granule-associated protein
MARKKTRSVARTRAANRLETTWRDARTALVSAEGAVGRRVAAFARDRGIDTKELARRAEQWRTRIDREGKKARKRALAGLAQLQQRAARERRSLAHAADEAVGRALAALNIPTRREVQELSRRVERLATRVGSLRR